MSDDVILESAARVRVLADRAIARADESPRPSIIRLMNLDAAAHAIANAALMEYTYLRDSLDEGSAEWSQLQEVARTIGWVKKDV